MAAVLLLGTPVFTTAAGNKTVTATPTVGDLIVIVTAHTSQTTYAAPTDNNTDGLGTYSLATSALKATSGDKLAIWVRDAKIGSGTSTVFTSTAAGSSGGGLFLLRVTGVSQAGSAAVRTVGSQDNQAAGTPGPVLSQAALTGNPLIGAVFNATSPATLTAPAGWTERSDLGYATPTTGGEVTTRDSGFTGTTVTWGSASASAFCSAVIELDTSPVALTFTATVTPEALWPHSVEGNYALVQGTTVIATFADATPPGSAATLDCALTSLQAAAITDYSDLRVRLLGQNGTNGAQLEVEWVQWETPQAASGTITSRTFTATETATSTLARAVTKPLLATETALSALAKRTGKALLGVETPTATLAAIKTKLLSLLATETAQATLTRQTGKLLSATETAQATVQKATAKLLLATETAPATLAAFKARFVVFLATETATATAVRRVGKTLAATETATSTLTRRAQKVLLGTETATATVATLKARLLTFLATETAQASLTRRVGKALQATETTTATVRQAVRKTLLATETATSTLTRGLARVLTFLATETAQATLVQRRVQLRQFLATQTTTATYTARRAYQRTFTATQTPVAMLGTVLSAVPHAALRAWARVAGGGFIARITGRHEE